MKHPYYAIFKAGVDLPKDLFSSLHKKINEEFFQFGMLEQDGNFIVPRIIHDMFQGGKDKPLIEELRENKCQIQTITEIFPNFPKSR